MGNVSPEHLERLAEHERFVSEQLEQECVKLQKQVEALDAERARVEKLLKQRRDVQAEREAKKREQGR